MVFFCPLKTPRESFSTQILSSKIINHTFFNGFLYFYENIYSFLRIISQWIFLHFTSFECCMLSKLLKLAIELIEINPRIKTARKQV